MSKKQPTSFSEGFRQGLKGDSMGTSDNILSDDHYGEDFQELPWIQRVAVKSVMLSFAAFMIWIAITVTEYLSGAFGQG